MYNLKPGHSYPQGATVYEDGTNFSIYSENATAVSLEFYDTPYDEYPSETIHLKEKDGYIWHVFVSGIKPGTLYNYRIDGPYKPELGLRFNKNKLLIDPYARAITSDVTWNKSVYGYDTDSDQKDLSFSTENDSQFVPKSVVYKDNFDWKGVENPDIPWNNTLIYETHIKGFTKLRADIGENIRGTYSGLGSQKMIDYLKDLGITAVEIMPAQQEVTAEYLYDKKLTNYWGYDTIGYFAPDIRFSSTKKPGDQINEFKNMVKNLHENNIEVIMDVVYNHTAEGNELGPTLSFKGIDNLVYYKLQADNPRYYYDVTGTGNSLDAGHPQVLRLIMDSLRYWITEMHVDGFRFDLASALARQLYDVNSLSAFFDIIYQDPVISRVKLIAEPWDVGPGGYQVGEFPPMWAEWNGKYRDAIRHYWKDRGGNISEFATRISGSPDLYQTSGRRPHSSINYVTSHDGFTMYDLVSYTNKHNENNLNDNKDGTDDNISENFGIEGKTEDNKIKYLRNKRIRSFFITLLTSQGSPMILGGDEIMRTQNGNNNAYCQDNEISWYDWNLDDERLKLLNFVKNMVNIRKKYAVLRRRNFFKGEIIPGTDIKDVIWVKPDGTEMSEEDWTSGNNKAIGVILTAIGMERVFSEPVSYDNLMLIFNPTEDKINFSIPKRWKKAQIIIDSLPEHENFPIGISDTVLNIEPQSAYILEEP
ncbi:MULTISPECIES: glycogen debranching protein GlgX [Acidiplasma]|uniref:Glycogen debranching protein n=2 Tax=Acidiplasma TaxID=507753 RepID=A0A0N8VLJ3_9ARCH|nr:MULTISPECIES: glycogen debranching protein GlgX [Acidiplasma]KJE49656.1 glycogen debranching protein [Acidiplasma sp. MBA-1]KPV46291.1 glycogen debranching protein [Acidiplasma aeolicum]KQB36684.1 glycogen debranching protein [Acidiplasma aeolicum]WMT55783.1 MAG: glycogen debranching protein GlgX [Acidiplasma sp.]